MLIIEGESSKIKTNAHQMHNRNGLYGWRDAWDQTLTRTRLLTAACTAATGLVRSGMAFPSTSPSSCMITKWDICWATGSRILSIVLVWKTGILKSVYPQHKWEKGTCSLQAMTLSCFPPLCSPRVPRSRCLFPSQTGKQLKHPHRPMPSVSNQTNAPGVWQRVHDLTVGAFANQSAHTFHTRLGNWLDVLFPLSSAPPYLW